MSEPTQGTVAILHAWLRHEGLVLCRAEHTLHALPPPNEGLALRELAQLVSDSEAVIEWNDLDDTDRTQPIPLAVSQAIAKIQA